MKRNNIAKNPNGTPTRSGAVNLLSALKEVLSVSQSDTFCQNSSPLLWHSTGHISRAYSSIPSTACILAAINCSDEEPVGQAYFGRS